MMLKKDFGDLPPEIIYKISSYLYFGDNHSKQMSNIMLIIKNYNRLIINEFSRMIIKGCSVQDLYTYILRWVCSLENDAVYMRILNKGLFDIDFRQQGKTILWNHVNDIVDNLSIIECRQMYIYITQTFYL